MLKEITNNLNIFPKQTVKAQLIHDRFSYSECMNLLLPEYCTYSYKLTLITPPPPNPHPPKK